MNRTEMISTIREEYAKIVEEVAKTGKEHKNDRKNREKKENFTIAAAQEVAIFELCKKIGVKLWNDDLTLVKGGNPG